MLSIVQCFVTNKNIHIICSFSERQNQRYSWRTAIFHSWWNGSQCSKTHDVVQRWIAIFSDYWQDTFASDITRVTAPCNCWHNGNNAYGWNTVNTVGREHEQHHSFDWEPLSFHRPCDNVSAADDQKGSVIQHWYFPCFIKALEHICQTGWTLTPGHDDCRTGVLGCPHFDR